MSTLFRPGLAAWAISLLVPLALGQFISPPANLTTQQGNAGFQVRFKAVPDGICETVTGVKSYSGYVDVEQDQHMFFYFVEARTPDPTTAPLTVWLSGGPGASSMTTLFAENGPCSIDSNLTVHFNPYSWNNASNMLYIDQPSQVGFSYSVATPGFLNASTKDIVPLATNTCPDSATGTCGTFSFPNASLTANSTPRAAPNVWRTVQGFTGVFPQYAKNGVYLASQSYGGHYVPIFADFWVKQNAANISGAAHIDLRGVSVNDGWYDPRIQYPSFLNYSVNNTFNFHYLNESTLTQMHDGFFGRGQCVEQLTQCNTLDSMLGLGVNATAVDELCAKTDTLCASVESIYDDVTGRDEFDIRELAPDPFPPTFFEKYLNQPHVLAALGAFTNFTSSSKTVSDAFSTTGDDARELNITANVRSLLAGGVRVLTFAGDADYVCNWLGGQAFAESVMSGGAVPGSNWATAGFENLTTQDGTVQGAVRQADDFTFARLYDSGHLASFYKPMATLNMFERLLNGQDVATGQRVVEKGYVSTGPPQSTFLNDNSTIQLQPVPDCAVFNTKTNLPELGACKKASNT